MKRLLSALFFSALAAGAAENLVFNSGFEMGTDGYAIVRILEPEVNPELKFLPLKTDTENAASGKRALRIENPNGEFYELHTKSFQLKPETDYTVSVKAKSDAPGAKIRLIIYNVVNSSWNVHARVWMLDKAYKNYSFTFNTGKSGTEWHIQIPPGVHYEKNVPRGSTWLDDLAVYETSKAAAVPETVLEASVSSSDRLYEKERKNAKLTLNVYNRSKSAVRRNLTVRGFDSLSGTELFRRPFEVVLDAESGKNFSFDVPLTRYGSVRVAVDGADRCYEGFYSVVGKYTARPLDLMKEPCVGVCGGLDYAIPPKLFRAGYQVGNAPFERVPEMLSRIGVRLMREHDGGMSATQWSAVEAEQGKFDFSHTDRSMAVYKKYNIELLPVLGRVEFVEPFRGWTMNEPQPEWVRKLSRHQEPDMGGWNAKHVILPPLELWEKYVSAVAEHLKGKIQAYEILNEPNLHLWPANYNTYLASAVKAIRKADPAAKIAAFCLTSDFGADGTGWLDECIRLGGFRNIDIAGFHPYSSRELASPLPADLTIETFRKQVRAVADIPLWNTELYYLYDVERGKPEMKQKAYHCAWRFLVDLGEGVGQSPFISSRQIFRNVLVPEFPGSSLFDTVPNESAVVFNAMARLFEGARPVLKRKFDQGIILYGFERRDGRLIAALWNFRYRKGLRMDLRGLEVLDMFGNPLKAGILPVGVEPFYLLQGAMSRGEFLRKLESLKPLVENPVAAVPLLRIYKNDFGEFAVLELKNESSDPQKGVVGLGGAVVSKKLTAFRIEPEKRLSLIVPVAFGGTNGETGEIRISCDSRISRVKARVVESGNVSAGIPVPAGPAVCRVFRENGQLVVEGTVPDATDAGVSGKRPAWETDSAELFFDFDPMRFGAHPEVYTAATARAFITPRDPEGKQLQLWGDFWKEKNCKLKVASDAKEWKFRLEFPSGLPACGQIGFEMIVNDSQKKRFGSCFNSKQAYCNRLEFGLIDFNTKNKEIQK